VSCWHGWHDWHGCGPWSDEPYGPGWYRADDRRLEMPRRGYGRRALRIDPEAAADDLEARLAELRDEVRRVEADLRSLRDAGIEAPEGS
jgi:hypothetical protein